MGKKRNKSKNKILEIISLLIVLVIVLTGKNINEKDHTQANTEITENSSTLTYSLEDIPEIYVKSIRKAKEIADEL